MEETYIITFGISEYWTPSIQLRWVEKKVSEVTQFGTAIRKEKVLQQLWTSNLGNYEWRDVPFERGEHE